MTDDFQSRGGNDAVRGVIRKNQRHIRSCYERRLHENPGLDGRIALDITVATGWEFPADVSDEIQLPLALSR